MTMQIHGDAEGLIHGGCPKLGVLFRDPHSKGYSIFGSLLGSPYFGKFPRAICRHGMMSVQVPAIIK